MSRVDARLTEMKFLAHLDRVGTIKISGRDRTPERQMIHSLLVDGYLNDGFEELRGVEPAQSHTLLEKHRQIVGNYLAAMLRGDTVNLHISHRGRVRLSELEQQLKTGRDRDDTGLLWAKRHVLTDIAIAILSAGQDTPLSVAHIDMNGLKALNDTHGHPVGDEAIRAFFQAVLATFGGQGEVYRNGGDEVVVILPDVGDEGARKLLDGFVHQLGKEVLVLGDAKVETRLTASCGSASTTDPNDDAKAFLKRADDIEIRAKAESKKHDPRVSAFAVGDGAVVTRAPG